MKQIKRHSAENLDPELKRLLFIVLLGGITPFLDTTIVNVAINTIVMKLNAPVSIVQWVSTGYLLSLSMAVPLTGWITKRFGSRRLWLSSLVIFMLGSLLCGLAWNIQSLIIFRIIQGFGAGLMQPTMTTILVQAASREKRTRLFITISNFAVIIPIFGPTIGGIIISRFAWQWIFFFNVPVCLAALILAWFGVHSAGKKEKSRLDFIGLLMLSPSLALIIYGLSQSGLHKSLTGRDIAILVSGLLLFTGFIIKSLLSRNETIIDLKLFRSRTFSISGSLRFLSGLALFGATFLVPLYCQQIRNMSALSAGMLLSLQGIGFILIRWVGKPIERLGPKRSVLLGLALVSAGTLAFTQAGVLSNPVFLGLSLILRGAGLGAVNVSISISAYHDISHKDIPHATSAIRIMQQLGGIFGVAVLAFILQSQLGHLGKTAAFNLTFWYSIAFAILAFLLALLLPNHLSKQINTDGTDDERA